MLTLWLIAPLSFWLSSLAEAWGDPRWQVQANGARWVDLTP